MQLFTLMNSNIKMFYFQITMSGLVQIVHRQYAAHANLLSFHVCYIGIKLESMMDHMATYHYVPADKAVRWFLGSDVNVSSRSGSKMTPKTKTNNANCHFSLLCHFLPQTHMISFFCFCTRGHPVHPSTFCGNFLTSTRTQ